MSAVINAPGSWHDARIARPIYTKLRDHTPDTYYLIADTAFPRGTNSIQGKIKASPKQGARLPQGARERQAFLAFNRELLSYRQTAEWGMRQLQGGFGRLRMPLDANDLEGRKTLLEVCIRLMQVRVRRVGISEIRNVYFPIWEQAEDDHVWNDLGTLVFGEVRRRDRVSRFYRIAEDS